MTYRKKQKQVCKSNVQNKHTVEERLDTWLIMWVDYWLHMLTVLIEKLEIFITSWLLYTGEFQCNVEGCQKSYNTEQDRMKIASHTNLAYIFASEISKWLIL